MKLVRDEPETDSLRRFVGDADLVSCELVLTEIPPAIRRAAAQDPDVDLDVLMDRAGELIEAVGLLPLERALLLAAGALSEPALRAFDAIHVPAAIDLAPLDGFVSYDERQNRGRAARGNAHVLAGHDDNLTRRRPAVVQQTETGPNQRSRRRVSIV